MLESGRLLLHWFVATQGSCSLFWCGLRPTHADESTQMPFESSEIG